MFCKDSQRLNTVFFAKNSISDVSIGSECDSDYPKPVSVIIN